jgi:hypothetical protein
MKKLMLTGAAVAALVTFTACGSKSSSSSGSGGSWCEKARTTDKAMNALDPGKASGPDGVKTMFLDAQSALSDLAKGAPSAIKADLSKMTSTIDSMVSIMKKYDYDLTKVAADADFTKLMGDATIQTSSDNISKYLKDNCGISDTSVAGSDTTMAAPDTTMAN